MNALRVWQHADAPEPLRYFVESESDPDHPHFVDLLEWRCSCPHWQYRCQPDPKKPACKHIESAVWHWAMEYLAEIRALTKHQ